MMMKTYQVTFQCYDSVEQVKADRYYIPDDNPHSIVTFYRGTGENTESVATFFLAPGDYVKMIETDKECCKCSEQDLSTQT